MVKKETNQELYVHCLAHLGFCAKKGHKKKFDERYHGFYSWFISVNKIFSKEAILVRYFKKSSKH